MGNIICYFFIFLAEAAILWQYASHLFDFKYKPKKQFAALCGLYFILFAASLFASKWLNAALYFIVNFIFFAALSCPHWYCAFFHSSILTAVMTLCELMVYYVILYFAPHFFAQIKDFHRLAVFALFSKLIFFAVVGILSHLLKERQRGGGYQDKSAFLLAWVPITSLFVMLTFIIISDSCPLSAALNWMVTLSAVSLLAINLLVFGISQYNQKRSNELIEMQRLLQKESDYAQYYEMLLSQNENQSILIHDIKKHLQSINILNDKKEHDKINAYIHQLMHSSDLREAVRLCDHELLSAILSRFQRQCMNRHIAFHADIRSGTMNSIADADITSLFCNLLDNALEAAENIPGSFIEVHTCKRQNTPFVVITVINSCRKDPFFKQDYGLPTKKHDQRKHGFGIKSVRKTVSKYDGDIQMYYNHDTLTFHTIMTLKQSACCCNPQKDSDS